MKPFVSQPIRITALELGARFSRADLVLAGVDHSSHSFALRFFFNNPNADETTPTDSASGYVGALYVFGHGGCFGDEGHCDPSARPRLPFDRRPPHQLTPATMWLIVTDHLRRAAQSGESLVVSIVPVFTHDPAPDGTLQLSRVSLAIYS